MMLDSIKGREPYQRMKERALDKNGPDMKPAEQQYTTEKPQTNYNKIIQNNWKLDKKLEPTFVEIQYLVCWQMFEIQNA